MQTSTNQQIAMKLAQAADLLEQQGANPFRVSAYRRASATLSRLVQDVRELATAEGDAGLIKLPNIGKGIARAIQELLATGSWVQLERMRGTLDPVQLFQTVPGIGPKMAEQIHETLHIDTLEALEAAAWDGQLETVRGLGNRRIAGIRNALTALLGKTRRQPRIAADAGPPVITLLDVDREYRQQAQQGSLSMIAPKRFNPEGRAWLPILHAHRGEWHFTLLYSNTARAHELKRTHDWVIVYFYDDDHHQEGQCTVVTETRGPLTGQRVVRGRELECRDYYLPANKEHS
ncbi:MAG: helix-hairpin-helix domain-containing protein [Gammaproteobacteria bacterium]|nr:helix-hairpin-helix domain-containing protein [Gammaproteobacteria bacterium]